MIKWKEFVWPGGQTAYKYGAGLMTVTVIPELNTLPPHCQTGVWVVRVDRSDGKLLTVLEEKGASLVEGQQIALRYLKKNLLNQIEKAIQTLKELEG